MGTITNDLRYLAAGLSLLTAIVVVIIVVMDQKTPQG